MNNKSEFGLSCLNGLQKYNPEIHIPMLIKTMEAMKHIGEFCYEAGINRSTFYRWLKNHEDFKDAYDKAHIYAEALWEDLPRTNPNINISYWTAIMRNRFKYYSHLPKMKGKSIKEKFDIYEEAAQEGNITIEHYIKLVASLENEIRLKEAMLKESVDGSKLTAEQRAEESGALIAFFVSKGYTQSEAAKMLINFSECSEYLESRRSKP